MQCGSAALRPSLFAGHVRPGGPLPGNAAHFLSGSAQQGADTVFGHTNLRTDFAVGFPFQVIESHDIGFRRGQAGEQTLKFLPVAQPIDVRVRSGPRLAQVARVVQGCYRVTFEEFADDDAAGDDGQIGCQAALAAKMAKCREVVLQQRQEHVAGQIVDVRGGSCHGAGSHGVVNHVHHQAQEAVYEIFPGTSLTLQTPVKELAIDFRKSHRRFPYGYSLRRVGRQYGPPPSRDHLPESGVASILETCAYQIKQARYLSSGPGGARSGRGNGPPGSRPGALFPGPLPLTTVPQ